MKCPHCTHPRVTLVDGDETCTWSEAWRHECEARHITSLPTLDARRKYLWGIHNKRGEPAMVRLRATVERLWKQRPAAGGG